MVSQQCAGPGPSAAGPQQDVFLNQGAQYLEAEKLDDAKCFEQVLALAPDNALAKDD